MPKNEKVNPYQVPESSVPVTASEFRGLVAEPKERASLIRTSLRWFIVCGISCVPSFVFGLSITSSPVLGMLTGVLIFTLAYTLLDYSTANLNFRNNREVSLTLKIAYGTRIVISIIFPIASFLDLLCGMVSVSTSSQLFGSEVMATQSFFGAVITTLIQGCLMNIVLAVYALLVHIVQLLVVRVSRSS